MIGALVLSMHDKITRNTRQELDMAGEAAAALVVVGNNVDLSVEALSKSLMLSHSGTVRLVDKLENQGLVERNRSSDDTRSVALSLTASGRRRKSAILKARTGAINMALDALTTSEQEALLRIAEKMLFAVTIKDLSESMCRLCEEQVCPQDRCPITLACLS